MTRWPWCLIEVALHLVLGGLVTAMALDVRKRWKQCRRSDAPAEADDEPDDDEPPPVVR